MGKKIRIRIRDEQPGSYFHELRNHFWGIKYLNSLMLIRDRKNSDPGRKKFGSGISIPDPQHWVFAIKMTSGEEKKMEKMPLPYCFAEFKFKRH